MMFRILPSREVALEIFGFAIHWYGVMYLLSFVLAYPILRYMQQYRNIRLTEDDISSVLTSAVLGVILGGRIGYVVFYSPAYYLQNPLEIFFVWNGGMSSHGGFLGVTISLWFVLQKRKIPLWEFLDIITVPIAIGLALGRIGNFINHELYGSVTNVPWAIAIPHVEGLRHPTQWYSVIQNMIITLFCFVYVRKTTQKQNFYGSAFALFLMLYSTGRWIVEYFRVQDFSGVELGSLTITRGQLLTIPIFLVGMFIMIWITRRSSDT